MQWVEQPNDPKGGCGIAALAMLLDVDYVRMKNLAPALCDKCGVDEEVMFDVLAEHGYAVQRLEQMRGSDEQLRKKWPPRPWAEKHLALVIQKPEDGYVGHYVVMDAKGNVYDPADSEYRRCKLTRYHSVEWVAAVVKVSETK